MHTGIKAESLHRIRQELDEIEAAREAAHEEIMRLIDQLILSHAEAKRLANAIRLTTNRKGED